METDREELLKARARQRGVLTSYTDVMGETHHADAEALEAVLAELEDPEPRTGPDPVRVAWDGGSEGWEPGYHREVVVADGAEFERLVISAPTRSFGADEDEFSATAFLPLYALRTANDWGVGSFTDLGRLRAFAAERGLDGVATLPLTAGFLDEPYDPSPYAPASRLFWNELYLDVERIPELERSQEARELMASPDFQARLARLRKLDHSDPRGVMAEKRRVLELLCRALFSGHSTRRAAFNHFVGTRDSLTDYARFRAGADEDAYRYHLYVQWLAEEQVREVQLLDGAGLCLDLPLGVSGDSFDVARYPQLFARGASGGAPPDELCETGQDWGFPPLKPAALRADGYAYLRACLSHLMRPAASLRIDHIMGLHRLFWVPRGLGAARGVYVTYPAEELFAVLSLESHRHQCRIVGENLGTVPPEINRAMVRHGIRGMYVLPFEMTGDATGALRPVSRDMQASLNTHDLAPFAAWWEDLPAADRDPLVEWLRAEGKLSGETPTTADAFRACLLALAGSGAAEVVLNLEDLWGETRRQNLPGTGVEMRNFTRRATKSLEAMEDDPDLAVLLDEVRARRDGAARAFGAPQTVPDFITGDDLYLFNEGTHHRLGEKLGSHLMTVDGLPGAHFAVWAPNAGRVEVIGTFNGWNGSRHRLTPLGRSGVFAGFIPGVARGDLYKYRIHRLHDGPTTEKADPLAVRHETPPLTASMVWDLDYEWSDAEWMKTRGAKNALDAPISVYEVHLGSFLRVAEQENRSLDYDEIAPKLAAHVKAAGFTHVELLPVMEHPFYGSWGYQVTGYYAPSSRYGTPQQFMKFVDYMHQEGIGVILDWVPSHFPADPHGLGFFDGTHLYEHADRRKGHHPDWDSLIFNYDRNEVRSFLTSTALHWIREFHADGLRTDAVASMLYLDYSRKDGEWIPNEYGGRENLGAIRLLKEMNEAVYAEFPDVQTIAEESTAWPMVSRPVSVGGLGFGLKWDMGWMHDTLTHLSRETIYRKFHQNELTFRQIYAGSENFMLSLSHDEVVHGKGSLIGKMPGDEWQKFANLRLLYADLFAQTGKKLLFMGCEFAQRREWDHEDSLSWHLLDHRPHQGMLALVAELNRIYRAKKAMHELDCEDEGFSWVDCTDEQAGVLSFLRWGRDRGDPVLVVLHSTPAVREDYRIGVPFPGKWRVILNTDEERFGGSGQSNPITMEAEAVPAHGHQQSLSLLIPPLGALFLARVRGAGEVKQ